MSKSNSQKQRNKTIATNYSLREAQIKKVINSEASEGTYEEWIATTMVK